MFHQSGDVADLLISLAKDCALIAREKALIGGVVTERLSKTTGDAELRNVAVAKIHFRGNFTQGTLGEAVLSRYWICANVQDRSYSALEEFPEKGIDRLSLISYSVHSRWRYAKTRGFGWL